MRLDVRCGLIFRSWKKLGYLSADLADQFAPLVDRNLSLRVVVSEVTGTRRQTRGVNIVLAFDREQRNAIHRQIRAEVQRAEKAKAEEVLAIAQEAEAKAAAKQERRDAFRRARDHCLTVLGELMRGGMLSIVNAAGRARVRLREVGEQQHSPRVRGKNAPKERANRRGDAK